MALNGLDHADISEAFTSTVNETGGWFLLKYATRDEVELFEKGTGGVTECRNAIAKHDEPSPLYGFLRYRRRSVIVKYMPEDCSALIKARATVHFNAICEQFTPHDTVFEISSAADLKDTKLSSACSLHAASGSQSSSSSSTRRRRLGEIAEEDEEEIRERKRQSVLHEEERPSTPPHSPDAKRGPSTPQSPVVLDPDQASSKFATTTEPPVFEGADAPASPSASDYNRRLSSQSSRVERYGSTYGRLKVKLGPRPSVEATKRPHSAENFRPTAALPAGFKLSKGSKKGKADDKMPEEDEYLSEVTTPDLSGQSFVIPEDAAADHILPPRPSTSSGASVKSFSTIMSTATTKDSKMTPEKARLMKAMKMREKKKKMSSLQPGPPPTQDLPPPPARDAESPLQASKTTSSDEASTSAAVDVNESNVAVVDANSDHSAVDSRPQSAAGASMSEVGDSTKASSISDSTDETVHPRKSSIACLSDGEDDGPEEISEILEEAGIEVAAEGNNDVETKTSEKLSGGPAEADPVKRAAVEPVDALGISSAEPKSVSDIKTTTIEVPASNQLNSPKSPYGVPLSKFASNDAKSPLPATPKSPRAPSLKSKFSTQDLKAACEPVPPLPTAAVQTAAAAAKETNDKDQDSPKVEKAAALQPPALQFASRKPSIEPIKTNLTDPKSPDSDIGDPLDDTELMDELESATVQEAKPMSVSKSPIVPVFPTMDPPKSSHGLTPHSTLSRTVSNPLRGPLLVPSDVSQSSARSVSAGGAALLHNITRQPSGASLQSKKGNVGSSISQRIKALEQLSVSTGGPETKTRPVTPSSTFFAVRKTNSIRQPSKSPAPTERASTLSPQCQTPEMTDSRPGTPEVTPDFVRRGRSGSMANRLSMFEGQPFPRGRPESVLVSARILRDAHEGVAKRLEPSRTGPQELRQSPITGDIESKKPKTSDGTMPKASQLSGFANEPLPDRKKSTDIGSDDFGDHKRRSSLNLVRGFLGKSSDNLSVMSGGLGTLKSPSRASTFAQGGAASPGPLSDTETEEDKKDGRASRFMRRLSNSFGGTRKTTPTPVSPTVAEEDMGEALKKQAAPAPFDIQQSIAAYIGDVNVQFPDNLLWKRRSLCLDKQGWLILSAVQGATATAMDKIAGAGIKRYHMSEFKKPYAPDVEVQELPNSVVLDLLQGSCLQVACVDRSGQSQVLEGLVGAHQKHTSYGQ